METRHPVEQSFSSEFLASCNHCGSLNNAKKRRKVNPIFGAEAYSFQRLQLLPRVQRVALSVEMLFS